MSAATDTVRRVVLPVSGIPGQFAVVDQLALVQGVPAADSVGGGRPFPATSGLNRPLRGVSRIALRVPTLADGWAIGDLANGPRGAYHAAIGAGLPLYLRRLRYVECPLVRGSGGAPYRSRPQGVDGRWHLTLDPRYERTCARYLSPDELALVCRHAGIAVPAAAVGPIA